MSQMEVNVLSNASSHSFFFFSIIFFDICNTNFTITSGSSCVTPGSLAASAITTTGATVSWSAVSGALSYDVDYKLNSSATWTKAATATTATSVSLSSLTSSSLYDWRV